MLTEEQIREAIRKRVLAVNGSCNSVHIHHNDGVFRGLIWALTGEDPGTYLTGDIRNMFDKTGIRYKCYDDGTLDMLDINDNPIT